MFKVVCSYALAFVLWLWVRPRSAGFPGLYFFVVMHAAAVLAYVILHPRIDSVQHWSILYVALAAPILLIIWTTGWACSPGLGKRTVLALLFTFVAVQNWPERKVGPLNLAELTAIQKAVGDLGRPASIGFIVDPSELRTVFERNVLTYAPVPELLLVDDDYNPLCLSVADIPDDPTPILRAVQADRNAGAAISRFVEGLKKAGTYQDYPKAQAAFVQALDMQWLLVSPRGTIPETLRPLVASEASFVGRAGWRWYRIESHFSGAGSFNSTPTAFQTIATKRE